MRFSNTGHLLVAVCCSFAMVGFAQLRVDDIPVPAKTPAPAAASPSAPAAAPAPFATSDILGPSLGTVKQTLNSIRVDKWKRGSVREEATQDINSMQRDMEDNLPPLMKEADAGQGSLSKVLPVSTHIDALYDVLLRVLEAARISAPDDQSAALRQALSQLGDARLALDEHMRQRAAAEETQISTLRGAVEKQASFKCPAPAPVPVCATPPPKPKKRTTSTHKTTPTTPDAKPGSTQTPPASSVAPKTGP